MINGPSRATEGSSPTTSQQPAAGTVLQLETMEVLVVKASQGVEVTRSRPPDLRAVHGPRGLVVGRWSSRLRWAELHARTLAFDEAFAEPEELAVFELWDEPGRWFARPVGDASLADPLAVQRLTDWASVRGLEFGPPLPERSPTPPPVAVSVRVTSEPPAFRFVQDSSKRRLRVHPWGRGAEQVVKDLREPWAGAVGDLVAIDPDRCVAHFARVPDSLRATTEALLRRWAADDGWELEIREALAPLAAPKGPSSPHPRQSVCTGCASRLHSGFASAVSFHQRGFCLTRCDVCGGRRVWFGQLEEAGRPEDRDSGKGQP